MAGFDPKTGLRGIVASLHTPFTEEDAIDPVGIEKLINHCARAGCCGVLVTAVAGEVGSLTLIERRRLLEITGEAARGRLAVVAGVSAIDFAESRALAREARAAGASMVLWQPTGGIDERALASALQALGDDGPGQVMLQDLDWHGPGLAPDWIARLAERVPAFTAVKIETAPAGPKYSAVQAATGERLHLSGGWAALQMPDGLARGLDAFMPSGLLPVYARIWALWDKGRRADALALFERCLPVLAFSNQHIEVSIPFWKQVRRRQNIFATAHCRAPIRPLDSVQRDEADRLAIRALELEAAIDGTG